MTDQYLNTSNSDCLEYLDDFFEGAEKRISIGSSTDLSIIDISQWKEWICKIGCNVLSTIENEHFTFLLLAESSFLVGKKYFMLKTCGKTKPLLLLDIIIDDERINVSSFKYSRPDLLKPELQCEPYNSLENEMLLMSSYENIMTTRDDKWLVCQHGENHEDFHELVCWEFDWDNTILCKLLQTLSDIFPTSIIDDKQFDPCGYSLNLLENTKYLTIHVTPQKSCSYLSVEVGNLELLKVNILFEKIICDVNGTNFRIHNNSKCFRSHCENTNNTLFISS